MKITGHQVLTFLLILGVGLVAFFIATDKGKEITKEIRGSLKQEVLSGEKIALNGNFDIHMEFPTEMVVGDINIKNLDILSQDKRLQNRMRFDELAIIFLEQFSNDEGKIILSEVDFIEKNNFGHIRGYITGERSDDWEFDSRDTETLSEFNLGEEVLNLINRINTEKDFYLSYNYASPYMIYFEGIYKTELGKLIIDALSSNNPAHFWEKYEVGEKIAETFLEVGSYQVFFEEVDNPESNQRNLILKKEVCEQIGNMADEYTRKAVTDECLWELENINKYLSNTLSVKQEGDIETLNLNGLVGGHISYSKGEIVSGKFYSPLGKVTYEEEVLEYNFTLPSEIVGEEVGFALTGKFQMKPEVSGQADMKWQFNDRESGVNFDGKIIVEESAIRSADFTMNVHEENPGIDQLNVNISGDYASRKMNFTTHGEYLNYLNPEENKVFHVDFDAQLGPERWVAQGSGRFNDQKFWHLDMEILNKGWFVEKITLDSWLNNIDEPEVKIYAMKIDINDENVLVDTTFWDSINDSFSVKCSGSTRPEDIDVGCSVLEVYNGSTLGLGTFSLAGNVSEEGSRDLVDLHIKVHSGQPENEQKIADITIKGNMGAGDMNYMIPKNTYEITGEDLQTWFGAYDPYEYPTYDEDFDPEVDLFIGEEDVSVHES